MRNLNIGVMGHVDSGKTSIVRALSTTLSTASLDKHPASRDRGITLDLGFSCLEVPHSNGDLVTLVDCPGHASLLRTVLCGARIIDVMMLVIDAVKGIQTQTAECVVIGEVTKVSSVVVVLNKIDQLGEKDDIETVERRIRKVLSKTRLPVVDVIHVAASPSDGTSPIGIEVLARQLYSLLTSPLAPPTNTDEATVPVEDVTPWSKRIDRCCPGTVILAVDHAFPIRGHGTILTGTVLNGTVHVGSELEIPSISKHFTRKVKTIQSFHKSITSAERGARIGISVAQLDSSTPERFYAVSPVGSANTTRTIFAKIEAVPYYTSSVRSHDKYHIHIGHEVVLGRIELLSLPECQIEQDLITKEFLIETEITAQSSPARFVFAVVELERRICVTDGSIAIGVKLDMDLTAKSCRIAFSGDVLYALDDPWREFLKTYREKEREGIVDRVVDSREAICRSIFTKGSRLDNFIGMKVRVMEGEKETGGGHAEAVIVAKIDRPFGKSGKVKVVVAGEKRFEKQHEGCLVKLTYRKFGGTKKGLPKRFVQR